MSPAEAVIQSTDSYDPATIECPWKFDRALRESSPVHHDVANDMYVVSSHELVSEVLLKPEQFSSRYMEKMLSKKPFPPEVMAIYMTGYRIVDALLVSDGELHERHRQIAIKAFSRKRLAELAPLFTQCTRALLDQLLPRGQMKFVKELATPVPLNILQQQLRIPDEDMARARGWSAILESGFGGIDKPLERMLHEAQQLVEFQHYFAAKVEREMERIRQTGQGEREDDLLTMLAQGILDPSNSMDMHEAISFLINLFPATNGTTIMALTATMHRFVSHPEVQARVAADKGYISKLIEEAMRHEAPVRAFWRKTLDEVTLGGVTIPKDKYLLLRISAANHDGCVYANADAFDADRAMPRQHLNFGTGIHLCAGRIFARHLITDVIGQLSDRASNFRFQPGHENPGHHTNLLAAGYEELHISFDPRP